MSEGEFHLDRLETLATPETARVLKNRLRQTEHYTDTHGYFAPRIKDLPEQRLWRLPDGEPYEHIEPALAGKLNVNLIRDTWDEMLRLVASIKYGEERASHIVSKLAAASHRNKLFRELQELGRLVKTAYLAEYFRSEELRRRVLIEVAPPAESLTY